MSQADQGGAAAAAMLLAQRQPLIPDDAGTVSHVLFNGAGLVDRFGNAWTQNGTVPQVPRAGRTPPGAGPFADNAYYSLPGSVLGFAPPFSACFVFVSTNAASASTRELFSKTSGTAGYDCQITNTVGAFAAIARGAGTVSTANAIVANVINVGCMGNNGASLFAKLNLGTLASVATGVVADTADAGLLGRYGPATGFAATDTTLYEAWFSTTTPSDAQFTAIMQRVKQRLGISAW